MRQIKKIELIVHVQPTVPLIVLNPSVMVQTARWHSALIANKFLSVVVQIALLGIAQEQMAQIALLWTAQLIAQIKQMVQTFHVLITVQLIVLNPNVTVPTARWHNVLIANKLLNVVARIAQLEIVQVQMAQIAQL